MGNNQRDNIYRMNRSRNGARLGVCSVILCYSWFPIWSPSLSAKAFVVQPQPLQQTHYSSSRLPIRITEERHRPTSIRPIAWMALSAGPESEDDDMMADDLYRLVAEQDPEWFQDFVTNILGEDSVDKELLALSRNSQEKKAQAMSSKVVLDTGKEEPTYEKKSEEMEMKEEEDVPKYEKKSQEMELQEEEEVLVVAASASASATSIKDVSSANNDDKRAQDGNETKTWFQGFVTNILGEESVDKELLAVSRTSQEKKAGAMSSKVVPDVDKEEPTYEKQSQEMQEEEDELVVEASATSIKDVSSANNDDEKAPDGNEENDATNVGADESSDEDVVVLRTDIDEDQDDTVPLTAVEEEEIEEYIGSFVASLQVEDQDETIPLAAVDEEEEEEYIGSDVASLRDAESSTLLGDEAEASSEEEAATSSRVILFRDIYSQSFVRIPLADVIALGYSELDIRSLEADALGLIASDGIVKPRSGVPSRWKVKAGQAPGQIRILSNMEADQVVSDNKTSQKKENLRNKAAPPRESANEEQVPVSKDKDSRREADKMRPPSRSRAPTDSVRRERGPSTTRKPQARDERDEPPRERRTRGERTESSRSSKRSERGDGRRRRIYDGRGSPKSKRERDDPPNPNSPVWVDINSFRDLLRTEAGLRLRILGDDWADTVKEESDWRLDLYKEWLWTLHNGVGNPIVESRSDRMRRKNGGKREDGKRAPPSGRPRKRR